MIVRLGLPSLLAVLALAGCGSTPARSTAPVAASGYDAALAERLGADEYGMAAYVVAFLHEGPNRDQSRRRSPPCVDGPHRKA